MSDKIPPLFKRRLGDARAPSIGLLEMHRQAMLAAAEVQSEQRKGAIAEHDSLWAAALRLITKARSERRLLVRALRKLGEALRALEARDGAIVGRMRVRLGDAWLFSDEVTAELISARPSHDKAGRQRWEKEALLFLSAVVHGLDLRLAGLPTLQKGGRRGPSSDFAMASIIGHAREAGLTYRQIRDRFGGHSIGAIARAGQRAEPAKPKARPSPPPSIDFSRISESPAFESHCRKIARLAGMSWDDYLSELAKLHPHAVVKRPRG